MSPAFLEAFYETRRLAGGSSRVDGNHGLLTSIALRRADCSQACPSARA